MRRATNDTDLRFRKEKYIGFNAHE